MIKVTAESRQAVVIGGGPAGLMAAEVMAKAGLEVSVVDQKPSVGRKLLMAGKSGLNLTKAEPLDRFKAHYDEAAPWLGPIFDGFGPDDVQAWAKGLDQQLFTGSTGRVFPKAMKASPLLRTWLIRLEQLGVSVKTRWRWTGWVDGSLQFEAPDGVRHIDPGATVLALGGASWSKLGSDGLWAKTLAAEDIDVVDFKPANAGLKLSWSDHMQRHFGHPLKNVQFEAGGLRSRGEAVISKHGLEGGGIYSVSKTVREGAGLSVDFLPDQDVSAISQKLSKPRGKASLSSYLRKTLKLDPAKIALLQEFARPLPSDADQLAKLVKALPIQHGGMRPIDQAISTAGGVPHSALNDDLMLKSRPGVFVAGEMLDWEAPTGGYLLTACFATGRQAGNGAVAYLAG